MRPIESNPVSVEPAGLPQVRLKVPPAQNLKRQILLGLFVGLLSIVSYVLISHFVLMSVTIRGVSMSPTLLNGDRYLLFRCPYLWRAPRQGEIVVIKDPEDQGLSIKRIVALPNDLVEIRGDGVYVNHVKLSEPYLTSVAAQASGDSRLKPTRLGENDYFVLGDNRSRSADSRQFGPVPRKNILGLITKSG
jgi:signal peptidase I